MEQDKLSVWGRLILSVVIIGFASWFNFAAQTVQPLILGQLAGQQFENSDKAYLQMHAGTALTQQMMISGAVVLLLLVLIWWRPLLRALRSGGALSALIVLLLFGAHDRVWAFAETTDKTEIVNIQPNESAFFIPNVGANKDTQVQLDSESYLQANKVAAKWFEITHYKLSGSSGKSWTSGYDLFVPTGRMIIVPRQPFSHEWVDAEDRGSSKAKEGLPCQTNQGLDFTVGVSVAATVTEEQAARFLYNFGVVTNPAAKRDDVQETFRSIYYARSLADVMQDNGRKRIQTLMCDQIMVHDIDYDNLHIVEIMNIVRDQATKYLADVGITLKFLGYGDTVHFDPLVQAAINRKYIAQQDKSAAEALQPYVATIQALAQADALRGWGQHADGKLPTTVVGVPPSLMDMLGAISPHATVPASKTP